MIESLSVAAPSPARSADRGPACGVVALRGTRLRRSLGIACLAVAVIAPSAFAQNDLSNEQGPLPTLEITPTGGKAFRVVVPRFLEEGEPVGERRIATLREEVERSIAFSGEVAPLARDAYLGSDLSPPLDGAVDCESWKQSGADAVVVGQLSRAGARLRADLRIVEVARCQDLRVGKVIGDRNDLAAAGRMIADEVVDALTGKPGVAHTEITFVSDRTGDRQVYVMSADGRNQRAATASRTLKMFPAWTADGRAILFTDYDTGKPDFRIVSRSPDIQAGPILRRVLQGLAKYRGRFDRAGEHLAFVASVDGAAEIFRVRRGSDDPLRLTTNPAIDISPSWSPDGSQLVFCSDRSGAPQLYMMDRDGGNVRRLTYTGAYNASPAWSPDGRWIAYETRVRGQFDIWLIDPSGQINFPLIQHARSDEAPTWSPDGRKLAFSSARRGRYDLYVTDWDGQNLQRLTQRAGKNIQPDWGPRLP